MTMILPPLAFLCSLLFLHTVADAFTGNPPAILPSAVRFSSTSSRHSVALTLQSNHLHSRWRSFDLSSRSNDCSPLIRSTSLLASSSSDNNIATNEADSSSTEADRLRQIANQLRAEADAAEKQLAPTRQQKQPPSSLPPVECFDINDSCWELTYRFADEPVVEEDEQKQDDDEKRQQRKVYSGKVKLKFKSDGYTTNLSSSPQQQQQTGDITFQKVWGWDIETSDQDSYNYILFSADIITGTESERFYFQARVDNDRQTGALQLNDGSVTVKRDIKLPGAGGFWGIFGGADKILAQFRAVGEFKCKPIACNLDEKTQQSGDTKQS